MRVIFAPAARARLSAEPAMLVPEAEMVLVPGVPDCPAIDTVMLPAPVAVFSVMLAPAASARLTPVPLTLVPAALRVWVPSAWMGAEIVMVELAWPIPMFAPAEIERLDDEPFSWKFGLGLLTGT